MSRRRVWGIVLIVAALATGPAVNVLHAQEPVEPPLVLLIEGDLWTWAPADEAFQQLTHWGHNRPPVIAPDGNLVAYESAAEVTVEAIERTGGFGGGATPSNIWVWNLATGEAARVTDQPPDASIMVDGVPDKGIARGTPTWSPDGAMLAWTELTIPDSVNRLGIYDRATGAITVHVVDVPEQYGVPSPMEVTWGGGGIAIRSITYDAARGAVQETILIYDPQGDLRASADLGVTSDEFSIAFFWIADGARDYVAVLHNTGRWALVDPASGGIQPMTGVPALYSALAQGEPVVVTFTYSASEGYMCSAIAPDGHTEPLGAFYPSAVALSPTGRALAFFNTPEFGAVTLWQDGALRQVEGTGGNLPDRYAAEGAWGPTAWRVWRDAGALPPEAVACPGFLPSRLAAGGQGRVLGNEPNNVRSEPATGSLRVGQIPGGGVFTALAGPQCGEGAAWWQVDYDGMIGWTAEGQGDAYWVEPLP